jgi:tol-pal system beta propeller repeat protein TolB
MIAGAALLIFAVFVVAVASDNRSAQSAFPGANGKIVFSSARQSGTELDLYVMDADGSNETNIFVDPEYFEATSAWSPDGSRIAFGRYANPPPPANIWLMDANGSNITQLTFGPGAENNPTWSPDGLSLTFESFEVDHYQIHRINVDGNGETNLSNNTFNDEFPAWSPDGTKIAFTSDRDGQEEIYVMDANGANQTRLTFGAGDKWVPRWSPDGAEITYWSDADGDDEIHVMDANGINDRTLTDNGVSDGGPSFSPDGTLIVYDSPVDGVFQIFTMSASDGSNKQQLTDALFSNFAADWQALAPTPTPVPTLAPNVQGNTDCANGVNATDMLNIVASIASLATLPCPENADVTCDAAIGLLDALDIGRWLVGAGSILPPPIGCRPIGEA